MDRSCRTIGTLRAIATLALLAIGMAARSKAQDLIVGFGPPAGLEFTGAAGVGDVDGDGIGDYAIGDTTYTVTVYSGKSGASLYSIPKPAVYVSWGDRIWSARDLNGDGIPEIAISGFVNRVFPLYCSIHDGSNGALLFTQIVQKSWFEPCGDLSGDGIPDFIAGGVTSSYGGSSGDYYITNGSDGSIFRSRSHWNDTGFGHGVAGTDDVDGDGVDDYLVGHTTRNRAYLYSGASGSLIQTYSGTSQQVEFGSSLKWMKDLDADGVGDFAVAVRTASTGDYNVDFISGASASVLHEVSFTGNDYVKELAAMGDMNGDGVVDLAITVGTLYKTYTRIELVSGRTGNVLYTFSYPNASVVPTTVRPGGDLDGDGRPDLVLCHPSDFHGLASFFGAYRGNALWLEADSKKPHQGDLLTLKLAEGAPSESTFIAAVEVNGVPLFVPTGPILNFQSNELRSAAFTVPPGLAGVQLKLRGALGSGPLRVSGVEVLDFQ